MGLLEGKVAVVTGAGSGMGKASAELFVAEGAQVVALDITGKEIETAEALGEDAISARCDVSDEADVEAAFGLALRTFGRVDSVLNVAGISGTPTPIHETEMDAYDRLMDINLKGVLLGTKYGIRAMRDRPGGGSIVNWSSLGGTHGFPGAALYCASKAGVIGLTRVAAIDYAAEGIRVNALNPGMADTPMNNTILQMLPDLPASAPIGRAATAEEVAQVAAFLCSDRAAFVTGAIIPVDGAWSVKVAT